MTVEVGPPVVNGLVDLKEKKEPSLGELNPILYPPDLYNRETIEALELVSFTNIRSARGLQPSFFDDVTILEAFSGKQLPRLVVRFETDRLNEHQISLLEQLTKQIYGRGVKTRVDTNDKGVSPAGYPGLEARRTSSSRSKKPVGSRMLGWYFGKDFSELDNSNQGILIYRDLGEVSMGDYLRSHDYRSWFFNDQLVTPMKKAVTNKYQVEVREAGLNQTDLVELITQISAILGTGEAINNPKLKHKIYNDLNRLGLKKRGKDVIYGLEDEFRFIDRVLFLPLGNLGATSSLELQARSILLVGVKGTGKTLVAEHYLQQDNGVFLIPVDALQFLQDLQQPPERRRILPRISEVFAQTQIPVVLHIDDVEQLTDEQQPHQSTLVNLMAGVRESGFYMLASTNHPERVNEQLIDPQRFGYLRHFGLPSEEARLGILAAHANRLARAGYPLFRSDPHRDATLGSLAEHTKDFTPRFLAEIPNDAKSRYLQRVSELTGKESGLTEADFTGHFTEDDWTQALLTAEARYKKGEVVARDRKLKEFVDKRGGMGFPGAGTVTTLHPFRTSYSKRLAALSSDDLRAETSQES